MPGGGSQAGLGAGLVWFPLIGLLLGGALAAADAALRWLGFPALLASALVVVLWAAATGALHLDGLIDTCDAVFAHATPQRRLEIMRDVHVGSFGAVGLAAVLLLKVTALADTPTPARLGALLLAPTLGRWAIVLASAAFPYGRQEGLGAPLKAAATPRTLVLTSLAPLAVSLAVLPSGPVLAAAALLATWLLGRVLLAGLPGLTGDCYGAICELVETLVLVLAAPLHTRLG